MTNIRITLPLAGLLSLSIVGLASADRRGLAAAQRKQVRRYAKYFKGYDGKLRRGVLRPAMVGGVAGGKFQALLGVQAEAGLLRVKDAHGMRHLRAKLSAGVNVGGGAIVEGRAGVTWSRGSKGQSHRVLAPRISGVYRVGGGAAVLVGAEGDVALNTNGGVIGNVYAVTGVNASPAVINPNFELNLMGTVPLRRPRPGRLRAAVDKGLAAAKKAQMALQSGQTAAVNDALGQLHQLRVETRRAAYDAGALRRP